RKRVQFALTSLGYEVSPLSGFFGPRTRAMIAAWQKAQGQAATGFLSGANWQALRQQAAPALSQFDPDQR
ncbi:MAG TPA: peptidoglycan-binding domain-containing protein, partial [Vineibacter sp.]|nr:peptidoglycan-binding domain-containing protein [Vineibacter sp.]